MHAVSGRIESLSVVQLWAFGDVVASNADLDFAEVALVVDVPEVPWLSVPDGGTWWSRSARLKDPLRAFWRSSRVPVWNHRIVQPVLLWDVENGVAEDAFSDLGGFRVAAPSPDELRDRLDLELATSLKAMRAAAEVYETTRWSPRKLEPVADDLHAVTKGYLDILDAR